MSAHNTQSIAMLDRYFGLHYTDPTPIIRMVFTPGKGWKSPGFNKHVSRSWLRKLKKEGVTSVYLYADTPNGPRGADFTIAELLKVDRRPLLTGNVIGAAVKLS